MKSEYHVMYSIYAKERMRKVVSPIFICNMHYDLYREDLIFDDRFTSLPLTATDSPPAVRPIRILPMNQYA
jgi:hypothetical protein